MKTKKLKCVVTGKKLFATKEYYEKKIAKYDGDEDKMIRSYMCKEAKRLLQQGYTVEKTRQLLDIDSSELQDVPDAIVAEAINSKKLYYRDSPSSQVQGIVNNTLHQTDPEVSAFLQRIAVKK